MKKIYILPNFITTVNIVCGVLAMISSIKGEFVKACWLIVISGVADSLDGRVARLAKATTAFGVQYDSLSDLTSFGIAPALLFYNYSLNQSERSGVILPVFFVVCAALRLARFNVGADENAPLSATKKIRKGYFQGLPSPAAAGTAVSTILFQSEYRWIPENGVFYFFSVITAVLAVCMISNIPFPSFKELNWRSKGKAWILFIPIAVILCIAQEPELSLFSISYVYLFCSIGWGAYVCWVREKKSVPQS